MTSLYLCCGLQYRKGYCRGSVPQIGTRSITCILLFLRNQRLDPIANYSHVTGTGNLLILRISITAGDQQHAGRGQPNDECYSLVPFAITQRPRDRQPS